MAADCGEGDCDRPATDEAATDEAAEAVERVRIKVGAAEGLRSKFAGRIAHPDIADGYAGAGMVPQRGGGDDLDRSFAAAVPPAHQPTARTARLQRGLRSAADAW